MTRGDLGEDSLRRDIDVEGVDVDFRALMTKTKITESLIRSSVRSLSRPATEEEISLLVSRLSGHTFVGPRHHTVAAIIDALNQHRGERYGRSS